MNIPYGPILVVEDMDNVRELLEVTLRFKGYPVISARDGVEALEKVEEQRPSLVVTDVFMPRMDGFNLVHTLRNDPLTSQIPIIFVSATYTTLEDKQFARSLGSVRFIEKPIDTEDFLLTIAEVITDGVSTLPRPMGEKEFYTGYRDRLAQKLRHKNAQIARTERLLQNLPENQKEGFEALLTQVIQDRNQIQSEMDELQLILGEK